MRFNLIIILFLLAQLSFSQSRKTYLLENRIDLRNQNSKFISETDFKIIGFGAYHGSAKTYEAELILLNSLIKSRLLDYYIIEGNLSQSYFFQRYLDTGDESLLKELVHAYKSIVTQEGTIETYNFWKELRKQTLKHPEKPLNIIGCDIIWEYKFPIKHILDLTKDETSWGEREALKELLSNDTLDFSVWSNQTSKVSNTLKRFVNNFILNSNMYEKYVKDKETFNFLIAGLSHNFQEAFENDQNRIDREKIIYDNFLVLHQKLSLDSKKLFAKYGIFHIQKDREDDYPSFFTRLIENNIYERDEVITVNAYLTNSKSLGRTIYDENGNFKSFTTYSGVDLDDHWKSYFKGIRHLKSAKFSDLTLFKLNQANSPYSKKAHLIEIKIPFKDYNSSDLKSKNTLLFIDYALLIDNSKEQIPIEEMK